MTTEQAIKELKSDRELYGSDIVYAGDGTPEGDLMLALDMGVAALKKQISMLALDMGVAALKKQISMLALDMGVAALKKQISKKVENYAIDCHGYMIYDCECPSCKTEHKEMHPFAYCPYCGQALDWGDYDG